ncbi:hypothetical protein CU024_2303 [Enterococcus faecium]|nr:hypothetical protein [Enterococcus faecium]
MGDPILKKHKAYHLALILKKTGIGLQLMLHLNQYFCSFSSFLHQFMLELEKRNIGILPTSSHLLIPPRIV